MTSQRVVRKSLAGEEDLLFGEGTVTQSRNGQDYDITKIRTIRPVSSLAELNALDTEQFKRARFYQEDVVIDYSYNGVSWVVLGCSPVDDIATLKTIPELPAGLLVRVIVNNTTSDAGGAYYRIKTAADFGTVPDGYGDHALVNTNVAELQKTEVVATQYGIVGTGDETNAFKAAMAEAFEKAFPLVLEGGKTYTVTEQLISSSTAKTVFMRTDGGVANFVYSGNAIRTLIDINEVLECEIQDISLDCANLLARPLDIRNESTPDNGGYVELKNVRVSNVADTVQGSSATGILITGEFLNIDVLNCEVKNVSRTDPAQATEGIAISNATGSVNVKGCTVTNISTPADSDADGLKIFGKDVVTPTSFLAARAEVSNNTFEDCEGRFIKLQISEAEVHGNTLKLSDGFSTMTSFNAIAMQSDNGHIHDNSMLFGTGMAWGSGALLFSLQNGRNTGFGKTSYATNNKISIGTAAGLAFVAFCRAEFGDSAFVITDNEITGGSARRGFQFSSSGGAANIDSAKVIYSRNSIPDYSSLDIFDPFEQEDYGTKLYLEITDNIVTNASSLARIHGNVGSFELDQFKIADNVNVVNRLDWPFDMDDLPGGNAFFTGGQVVANKGPGVATFFHVTTHSGVQFNMDTVGTTENRRGTNDGGATWQAWV